MELYIDRYKPATFDQIGFCEDANEKLACLARSDGVPHIILKGRRGSGKRTRAMLFLKEKFGNGVFNIKNSQIEYETTNKTIELQISSSPYHYQINPSVHGVYDRVLLQKFIDEIVKYKILSHIPYRVIIVEDADLLTHEAQQSLRRTMETRIKNCRFIFLVNQEGHMIDPIYSRCSVIGVASPSNDEIRSILTNVIETEKATVPPVLLEAIIAKSDRNITTSLHSLQKVVIMRSDDVEIDDNQRVVDDIIQLLIEGADLTIFDEVRTKINELFINSLSGTAILSMLMKTMLSKVPKSEHETIYNICRFASDYDNTLRLGGKFTYHIEAFCLHLFKEIKVLMDRRTKQKKPSGIPQPTVIIKKGLP